MDYIGILKEAWGITWKYRALWILGLFLGASGGSGGGGGSSNFSTSGSDIPSGSDPFSEAGRGFEQAFDTFGQVIEDNIVLIVAGITFFALFAIIMWVLRFAARGGMIDQTNEAVAGRPVSARTGWSSGFRNWGKVFVTEFLLYLPAVALSLVGIAIMVAGGITFDEAGICGSMLFASIFFLAALVAAVVASIVIEVALRRGVLDGYRSVESIKVAWADLRASKGVFVMWLVMVAVGFAFGIISAVVFVPLVIVMGLVLVGAWSSMGEGALWLMLPMGIILIAVGALVSAIYGTFINAAWTSFYVRMTAPAVSQAPVASEQWTAPEDAGTLPPPPPQGEV